MHDRWRFLVDFYISKLSASDPLRDERIVWHSLRSSMMLLLFALGKELFEIKILARHADLRSTIGYQEKAWRRATLFESLAVFRPAHIQSLARAVLRWCNVPVNRSLLTMFSEHLKGNFSY